MTSQIGSILSAASSVCPQLTALLLPLEDINRNERSSIFMDLYAALERWHKSNGGLRQLRVSRVPANEQDTLLGAVTSFCPKIEYLQTYCPVRRRVMDDWPIGASFFKVQLETWRAFCDKCTNLCELDWSMVPSKEEFVCAFSAKKWLMLSELRIRSTATSSSSQFKRDDLCSVFNALPSLRVIELDTGIGYASDDVLQDLAARCPALETIRVRSREQAIGPTWSVFPMSFLNNYGGWRYDLTSKGLQTLLEMPLLGHIHVEALRDEDNSSLINTLRLAPPRMCRHVDLTARYEAHKMIVRFLRLLSEQDSDALQNLQLSIQLMRGNFNSSSSLPTGGIGKLLAQIQAKHAKAIKRLHLQTSKPTSYFDDENSVVLYGCEVWINYVEAGRLEDCKFECIYEDGNNYF